MLKVLAVFVLIYTCTFCVDGAMSRNWDYTIIDSFTNTTDDNLLKCEMKAVRVGRGDYAISGAVDINLAITDDFVVLLEAYRSKSGVGEYTKIPIGFEKQSFYDYLNNWYKNFVMDSIKDCSNMPQFEGDWTGQIENVQWRFDKCLLDQSKLPPYMQTGYYKLQFSVVWGNEVFFLQHLIKVESKVM